MKKVSSIITVFIILGAFLIFLNPVSAGNIHVYPGDDIVAKIGAAEPGDTVYVHYGTYDISTYPNGIEINNPNVTIIGDDPLNTIIDCRGGSDICIGNYDYTNKILNDITIKNLGLRNFQLYGITFKGSNVTIENCKFDLTTDVIPVSGDLSCILGIGDNWSVKNVSMSDNIFYNGIRIIGISGYGNNWLIDGFEFDRNLFKITSTFRPVVGGGNNWTIKNGTVNNNTLENGEALIGVYLAGKSPFLIKNISISGNKLLRGTYLEGINLDVDNPYLTENSLIINCTVSNNSINNIYTDGRSVYGISAIGVGITVENCIVSSNTASDDLTPVYGIWVPPLLFFNSIIYSNSWNNKDNWGQAFGGVEPGEGCISVDPIFTKGPLGEFYLSNLSPCVDSGSDLAKNLSLSTGFTTNVKGVFDRGTVDMGYHYPSIGGSETQYLPVDKIIKILKENEEK